jgi:hypothetical protein
VQKSVAQADADERSLQALQAEVQACLALNRAMLRALTALSPVANTAADAALEEEAEQSDASRRTVEIIAHVRDRLRDAPAEARLARALERALVEAAEALPAEASRPRARRRSAGRPDAASWR